MKESDLLPTTSPATKPPPTSLFAKSRYKFWALAAILLLAFWSMLTGTVTLKWSAGNLTALSDDDLDSPSFHHRGDVDVLEVEEREKVVRRMWDVYIHSRRIRLPRFWQEAFEAAYEEMASDDEGEREKAVGEIAMMSMRMVDLDPPLRQSKNAEGVKNQKDGRGRDKSRPSTEAAK